MTDYEAMSARFWEVEQIVMQGLFDALLARDEVEFDAQSQRLLSTLQGDDADGTEPLMACVGVASKGLGTLPPVGEGDDAPATVNGRRTCESCSYWRAMPGQKQFQRYCKNEASPNWMIRQGAANFCSCHVAKRKRNITSQRP